MKKRPAILVQCNCCGVYVKDIRAHECNCTEQILTQYKREHRAVLRLKRAVKDAFFEGFRTGRACAHTASMSSTFKDPAAVEYVHSKAKLDAERKIPNGE